MRRISTILTSEQAGLLYDLVKEHRSAIVAKRSHGVWDGLMVSLAQIDRHGGACLADDPIDYGCSITQAAIVPAASYVFWPNVETVPGPLFEPVGRLADLHYGSLSWRPVSLSRVRTPLAIVPLPAVAPPPPLPLR